MMLEYLTAAGASVTKSREIQRYVEKILEYELEFSEKSKADKAIKLGRPRKIKRLPKGGHWITLDGKHIFVEEK